MPSERQEWRTPLWFFQLLEREVVQRKFQLDAAASAENTKCRRFYGLAENGLTQPWRNPTFCNPNYEDFGSWVKKAFLESSQRNIVSCMIGPGGCSQEWFHHYAKQGTVYLPDQRIAFCDPETGGQTPGARSDSAVYVFGPGFWNSRLDGFTIRALHVRELARAASPKLIGRPPTPVAEKFWRNVKRSDTCWLWTAGRFENGYGQFSAPEFSETRAHRVSYRLSVGPIPEDLYVCHSCDVKLCVNPAHLWLGTNQDNQLDALAKGRLHPPSGDQHYRRRKKVTL